MTCSAALSDPAWLPIDTDADLTDIAAVWAAMEALVLLPASPEDRAALERRRTQFREQLHLAGVTEDDLRAHARSAHGHSRHLRVVEEPVANDQCPTEAEEQPPARPERRESMPSRKSVHTVPRGKGWANKSGGRTVSVHRKKSAAQSAGRSVAKKRGAEHVIHKRNGRIGDSNSYGNDPFPPRG